MTKEQIAYLQALETTQSIVNGLLNELVDSEWVKLSGAQFLHLCKLSGAADAMHLAYQQLTPGELGDMESLLQSLDGKDL